MRRKGREARDERRKKRELAWAAVRGLARAHRGFGALIHHLTTSAAIVQRPIVGTPQVGSHVIFPLRLQGLARFAGDSCPPTNRPKMPAISGGAGLRRVFG